MNKKKTASPVIVGILFAAALAMIVTGAIGGVKAAPLITNDRDYEAEIVLSNIGIQITENGEIVPDDVEIMEAIRPIFQIGRTYDEPLAVINTGDIPEYVRVSIYRYWLDAEGKAVDLDPSLIRLHFVEGNGWHIDPDETTVERTVMYYESTLAPGELSTVFVDQMTIDGWVTRVIAGDNVYAYNGLEFHVEVIADGVQDHNGTDAMISAWGHTNE